MLRRALIPRSHHQRSMRITALRNLSSVLLLHYSTTVFAFATSKFPSSSFPSSSRLMSSQPEDRPFGTWSFHGPCTSMEWSELVNVTMETSTDVSKLSASDDDLVILGVFAPPKSDDKDDDEEEEEQELPVLELIGVVQDLDKNVLQNGLSDVLRETVKSFKNGSKAGSITPTIRVVSRIGSVRYALMGLGPSGSDDGPSGFELGKGIATKLSEEKKVTKASVYLPESVATNFTILQDLTSSLYQNLHSDNRYRTGTKVKKMVEDLKTLTLVSEGTMDASAIQKGQHIAAGVVLSKDIVNAPHNVLNSLSLADTARRIADLSDAFECQVLNEHECEELGMGAYLGVARGSETPPQFIVLSYTPSSYNATVGVIGKGLLFDTGGYNIKTKMMELMKFDCGGSAAVFGAALTIAKLQPPNVRVHFIVAACENMISSKSCVPSDILTAMNGKTIEVLNTDAEGRLTLADAMVYADKKLGCEKIIELSTLTGACMVALGKGMCGLWTSNDALASELEAASKASGDKAWRMPLAKEYNEQLESKIADLKNIGGPYGGSITAALFLQNFVSPKKPFAHLDIAGPVWNDKAGVATGFGTKLVVDWITRQGNE